MLLRSSEVLTLAGVATELPPASGDLDGLRSVSPLLHSGAARVLLLVAATLSVYKPPGMTRYGQSKQRARRQMPASRSSDPAPADSA